MVKFIEAGLVMEFLQDLIAEFNYRSSVLAYYEYLAMEGMDTISNKKLRKIHADTINSIGEHADVLAFILDMRTELVRGTHTYNEGSPMQCELTYNTLELKNRA